MDRITRLIPLKDNAEKNTHLEIKVYYSLGGMNYWTGTAEERGYYISVTPVIKKGCCTTMSAFSGIKQCMIPCNRQSKKKAEEAANIPQSEYQHLIDRVLIRNNLEIAE